jgi:hypothetical protein
VSRAIAVVSLLCPITALVAFGCAPTVGEQWAIAKGTVVESGTAAPIEGAFIVLAGYEIYSDAQGGFLIDHIPIPEDPESTVTVSCDRFRTYDAAFLFDAPGTLDVQLLPVVNPDASGTLDGMVRNDATEEPLAGAEVAVRILSGIQVLDEQKAHTSFQGNWQVSGIPIGEAVVQAVADGFLPAEQVITVLPGRASNPLVVMDLTEGTARVEVRGKVFDVESGEAIAGATVMDDREETTATTAADGTYTLPEVLVGQRTFRANAEGYDPSFVTALILADPAPVEIGMARASGEPPPPPGTIAGHVRLQGADTHEGVRVVLRERGTNAIAGAMDTDESGAFAFLVPPGSYVLSALKDGYEPATLDVDLSFGLPQRGLRLELAVTS